jgi:hypothetical protein
MEILVFEVVDFSSPYHIILGRPCYIKFMTIPRYTYLKLKILGPAGVITIGTKAQQALDCEQSSLELSPLLPATPLSPAMPPTLGIFKMGEDARAMQIDIDDPIKTVQIGASLDPKLESELIDFFQRNKDLFVWSPVEMPGVSREVTEHTLNIKPGSKPIKQGLSHFN